MKTSLVLPAQKLIHHESMKMDRLLGEGQCLVSFSELFNAFFDVEDV